MREEGWSTEHEQEDLVYYQSHYEYKLKIEGQRVIPFLETHREFAKQPKFVGISSCLVGSSTSNK